MARLYREAPLNGIWEGSGNIIALDVLRAARKSPASVPAFLDEVRSAKGCDKRLDRAFSRLEAELRQAEEQEARARRIVEMMAVVLQASLLVRHAPAEVADAFCAGRLGEGGRVFGTLPASANAPAIVERALAT